MTSTGSSTQLDGNTVVLGPVRVTFERTLRIPEEGIHPLPPGLGEFPVRRVEDYPDTVPPAWLARGGVMLPVYQCEAMWMSFDSVEPAALQVGIGKVCAVSGTAWEETLRTDPQNYVCLPDQPWLDGINAGDGFIRQFVAVPLGSGATVEAQVTGVEEHGGIQLRAVGLTDEALQRAEAEGSLGPYVALSPDLCASSPDMGMGAGGRMRQEIYADDRPLDDYDPKRSSRVFVHLCSALQWAAITCERPPSTPSDREAYVRAGLPWFDYYDADREDLPPAQPLTGLKTVGQVLDTGTGTFTPVDQATVIALKDPHVDDVSDGDW